MNERPILFSGPMIRAILEGRKTQTRRVVKPQPEYAQLDGTIKKLEDITPGLWPLACSRLVKHCPYGAPGDRLWVRETWHAWGPPERQVLAYRADSPDPENYTWRPSIHMPRKASRITLELTGVRVQQLRDISGYDALREGVTLPAMQNGPADPTVEFMDLWDSINAKRGYDWASNPYVWVLEFRRLP